MHIAFFFSLAFGLSWSCWIPAALATAGMETEGGRLLIYAGGAGPLLATVLCLSPASQRETRAEWWRRLVNVGGLVSPAGALCVLVPVLVAQLSLDTFAITTGIVLPPPPLADALAPTLLVLLLGATAEELAWRGYALPAMIRHRNALAPTLLLSLAWGAWQLPLFFVNGTYHSEIALVSVPGLLFFTHLAGQSVLMSAFYLATRCTWAAILFHWLTSLLGELWQLPLVAEAHRAYWTLLLAGIVVLVAPPFGIRQAPRGKH